MDVTAFRREEETQILHLRAPYVLGNGWRRLAAAGTREEVGSAANSLRGNLHSRIETANVGFPRLLLIRDIDLLGIMFTRNRIEISGNITGAAKTREVGDAMVTKARLVHNQFFRMPDGSTGERLVAIDLEIWGKRGEAFAKYVTAMVPVVVEGQLLMDQWQDKVGPRRSRFLVRVQNWQFLSPKLLPEDDPILNESGGGEPAAVRQREPVEIGQTG